MCKPTREVALTPPLAYKNENNKSSALLISETTKGLSVDWQRLRVGVGPKNIEVLKGVNGCARAGELSAVLGPSGSGKSTLLSCVSARFASRLALLGGRVRYDGAAWDRSRHKRRVAFVEQEDALLRDLTVRQTLTFAAALRGARDAAASAAATLKALGLESCADQAIGGANVRREISGGQRRRVTIGHELLLDPGLVLLDEPTSGLDSHAAAKIFALLVELKNGGRAVLATLHQPTDFMMLGFDALHLLRDGRDVYTGRAAGAVTALAAASGVEKPPGVPAADFLLDVVCAGAPAPPAASELDAVEEEALADVGPDAPLPWRRQYALLLRRCFLAHRLDLVDPMFMANVFSIMILATCLWSGEAAKRPRDETSVRDAAGLLFLAPVYWAFQIMITSLQTFPPDFDVVTKERAAGLYSISAYFVARTSIDTVTSCLLSPASALLYYFVVGYRPSGFGWHVLVLFLNSLAAHSAGLCIGAWVRNMKRAMTLQTVYMLTTMICGGFYVTRIPTWLEWVGDLSFIRYAYSALIKIEYAGAHYDCPKGRCRVLGDDAQLKQLPGGPFIGIQLSALAAFGVGFRLLAFWGLKRNTA